MTIPSTAVEPTHENAQRALKRAKALLTVWAPLVRVIARNPKLKVELTAGASRTDSKTVWLRVPLELAFNEHEKRLCGKWDKANNGYLCPACDVELECTVALFHECAHLVADSFNHHDPDDELIALLQAAYPEHAHRFDRLAMSLKGTGIRRDHTNTLVARIGERLPDQWGFFTFNTVEDVYVNATIFEARPGLLPIFRLRYERVFNDGTLTLDGKRVHWSDKHPFLQALVGWNLVASRLEELTEHLSPEVVSTIRGSEVLMDFAARITDVRKPVERWKIALRIMLELRELGLDPRQPARKPEPPSASSDEEDDESRPTQQEQGGAEGLDADPTSGDDAGDGGTGEDEQETDDASSSGSTATGEPGDDAESAEGEPQAGADGAEDGGDFEDSGSGEGSDEPGEEPGDASWGDEPEEQTFGGTRATTASDGDSSDDASDGDGAEDEVGANGEEGVDDDGEPTSEPSEPVPYSEPLGDPSGHQPRSVEVDHEASYGEGEVELDYDEAVEAMKALTGHEGFGDIEKIEEEYAQTHADPEDTETRLIEAALSFDGHLEGDPGSIARVISEAKKLRWTKHNKYAEVFEENVDPARYALPVEVRVASAQQMRLAFSANKKVGIERGLTSGPRVDPRTMGYRIPTGDDRIFSRRSIPKRRDWTVLIGIDVSGSTFSGAIEIEKMIAMGLGDLLSEIGIPFSMYLHTATYNDDESKYNLVVLPVKGEHEKWDAPAKKRAAGLSPLFENLDGHTMEMYRHLLERQRGTDKLLMYFTDGKMPAANSKEERPVLERECALLKRKGIYTVGVGIGTDSPRQYGLDTIRVDGVQDVPALLSGIGERLSRPLR